MSTTNDGGPAFARTGTEFVQDQPGMSLRDWFAGQAICATGMDVVNIMRRLPDRSTGNDPDANRRIAAGGIARDCYRIADAMLAAREAK